MKIKGSTLINIALLILILYSIIDRLIFQLPNIIAIPILILGVLLIFVGWYKKKGDNS